METGENPIEKEAEFENDAVDPGFTTDGSKNTEPGKGLKGKTLKDIANIPGSENNDALNYGNDRQNGAFNPKNI